MEKIVLVMHVLASIVVIGLVLLQHGKGADMGASFGSGASGSLFGVSGSANFLSRATAISVVIFFCTSLSLAYLASHKESASVVKSSVVNTQAVGSSDADAAKLLPADEKDSTKPTGTEDIPN